MTSKGIWGNLRPWELGEIGIRHGSNRYFIKILNGGYVNDCCTAGHTTLDFAIAHGERLIKWHHALLDELATREKFQEQI